ncbi:Prostaglandin E synthase [Zostera marina]|uniref:Prostaglandin E synthase 2 n=1 Tax=Zostera marina TaxID=29655 RepID=A0A0K9PMM9_ZOSMR|nr:Prostaglandin E synthase [Zostera marina]
MNRSKALRSLLFNAFPRCTFSSPHPKTMLRSAACGVNTSSSPISFSSVTRPDLCGKLGSYGLSGSYSFSMTTVAAEAKPKAMGVFNSKNIVLYQYEACPFCNKVRAFLDFHDIPYKIVEVNPLNKKEIKWSGYKKVPILVVDGEQLVDSSDIIDKLNERIHSGNTVTEDEESKWRGWVDDHLVHMLSPNIYRSPSEAIESFDYITSNGNFSLTERITVKYVGAAAMYLVSKKLKKRHNITDERRALYDSVETWLNAIDGRDFLGGSKPNLADLAVFGVLRPIRHLKAGKDMVENTHIGDWFDKMEASVGKSSRSDV